MPIHHSNHPISPRKKVKFLIVKFFHSYIKNNFLWLLKNDGHCGLSWIHYKIHENLIRIGRSNNSRTRKFPSSHVTAYECFEFTLGIDFCEVKTCPIWWCVIKMYEESNTVKSTDINSTGMPRHTQFSSFFHISLTLTFSADANCFFFLFLFIVWRILRRKINLRMGEDSSMNFGTLQKDPMDICVLFFLFLIIFNIELEKI